MKSMQRAHIIIAVDDAASHGVQRLAGRLRRMAIGRVTTIAGIVEARELCRDSVDACLVVIGDPVPDTVPELPADAPGRPFGIPTLIVVPVVTSYLRKTARLRGYVAVLPAKIAPRMLYRRIGAVLQGRRRRRAPAFRRIVMTTPVKLANFAKPTAH